jgi:hypothetical protein
MIKMLFSIMLLFGTYTTFAATRGPEKVSAAATNLLEKIILQKLDDNYTDNEFMKLAAKQIGVDRVQWDGSTLPICLGQVSEHTKDSFAKNIVGVCMITLGFSDGSGPVVGAMSVTVSDNGTATDYPQLKFALVSSQSKRVIIRQKNL